MKNTLQDLNNHLFEQLERLNDDEIMDNAEHPEFFKRELEKSKAVASIASTIIMNARVQIEGMRVKKELGITDEAVMPDLIKNKNAVKKIEVK